METPVKRSGRKPRYGRYLGAAIHPRPDAPVIWNRAALLGPSGPLGLHPAHSTARWNRRHSWLVSLRSSRAPVTAIQVTGTVHCRSSRSRCARHRDENADA
jgi:hypothetical protein